MIFSPTLKERIAPTRDDASPHSRRPAFPAPFRSQDRPAFNRTRL